MAKMDEFREERAAIKDKPFKERAAYFFEYYGVRTFLILACVIALIYTVINVITRKDTGLYVAMFNTVDVKMDDSYVTAFAEYAGIDTDKEVVVLDEGYYLDITAWDEETSASIEKTTLYMTSQDLDIIVGAKTVADYYAYNDVFMDVRNFLTPEQIEKYESSFYYIDMEVVEARKEWTDTLATEYNDDFPDPKKPEEMKNPVPVGIFLGDVTELAIHSSYAIYGEDPIFCVVMNTRRPERASLFLDYITQ